MINDNQTVTRNTRTIIGPSIEIVRDTDDIINVDTNLGAVTLSLQNIRLSGLMLNPRCISVNDIGLNAAVNPITILPSGSDLVNSGVSVIISVNGANAKCVIASQNEWSVTGIGVTASGISGSGTVNRVAKFTTPTAIGDSDIFDNGVSVGVGIFTPNASAKLDVASSTQGFLTPRMRTALRNAIATPATGLIIYNTDTNQFNFYNGTIWTTIGTDVTLYNGNGTIGTNRVATLTDSLTFNYVSGSKTTQFGMGADPLGFGAGVMSYFFDSTPGNIEAWGGLLENAGAGDPAWWHEVYNVAGDASGFFSGYSTLQTNPYSSVYHTDAATGSYRGFEANAFGEQLYSQRTALVTTPLTVNDRVLFVSSAGGYIKATTYANLLTQLAVPTFYSANGSTVGARTVTLGGTLQFNHGAAGVNGYVQMLTGGYFRNNGANPNNYFEFNHNTNIFTVNTTTASVSGFTAANNAANLRAEVTSGGYAGLTISGSTVELGFYVNGGVKYAGGISGGTTGGNWGFGIQPTAGAKVYIISENGQGYGTIIGTNNLSPSEYILQIRDAANFTRFGVTATGVTLCDYRFVVGTSLGSVSNTSTLLVKGADSSALTPNFAITDGSNNLLIQSNNAGQFGINTTDFSSGLGGITHKFAVRANGGDYGNHTLSLFENNLNPTSNNANYQRASTSIVTKYGAFNTYNMVGSYSAADIQGGGTIGEVYGQQNAVLVRGAAVVTDVAGIFADKQVQLGTITNLASIIAHTTGLSGGTITNMMGLWVRTPVNVIGGTRTNTYGVLIEPNAVGTNNYGVIVSGNQSNGLGTLTPSNQALLELVSTDKAFLIMRMTAAQASAITPANGMMLYVTNTNGTFTVVGFWGYENGTWVKL